MSQPVVLPKHFTAFPGLILTGFDGKINYAITEQIKNRTRFSEYAAWGVSGKIWWDERTKNWNAEVWRKKEYLFTHNAPIIEDLAFAIKKEYGWK